MTTRPPATRHISAIPAARSSQWWTVSTARAASASPSASGMCSAVERIAGAAPGSRWSIMVCDGSIAQRVWDGSYDPAPAPTLTTADEPSSARSITAAMRGSGRRVSA